ncbi:Major capsid protein N-terminus [seawater metagenome]|uniref:Major capsid protein N-terminus n=1 Tax=seawater metagenome TaxID=1561972 RepID=A0A5E8CJS6_9ZZZZ
MPSGLIQLVSLGVNDLFLTGDPQITFFKIVYRRYTNFSIQTIELSFDEIPDFGKKIVCNIPSNGDLIHKSYLKIELPSFDVSKLNIDIKTKYSTFKQTKINDLEAEKEKAKNNYMNTKDYSYYIIEAYKIFLQTMRAENVTITDVKTVIINYNTRYSTEIKKSMLLMNSELINRTNIISYIINYQRSGNINFRTELSGVAKIMYDFLKAFLNKIFVRWQTLNNNLTDLNKSDIKFAWIKNIGNFIFNKVELEIGGHIIETRTSDWMYIMETSKLPFEKRNIYDKLIGNIPVLTNYNNNSKDNYILYIPLEFSFCKHPGLALPLVALRYQDVNININLNSVNNCCYFDDYENTYLETLYLTYEKGQLQLELNNLRDDEGYLLNFQNLKFEKTIGNYSYKFTELNYKILNKKFNLNQNDIEYLLNKYGSYKNDPSIERSLDRIDNENTIDINQFYNMLYTKDYKTQDIIQTFLPIIPESQKQIILNTIHLQDCSLLVDYIFLDNMERQKFAQSHHEYLIEQNYTNSEPITSINNVNIDLSFFHPIKELMWYTQPITYITNNKDIYLESKYGNYSNSYLINTNNKSPIIHSQLSLNNINIFPEKQDNLYFTLLPSYKLYKKKLPTGVNVYSFSLFPLEYQPSGSCNFTTFKSKMLRILVDKDYYSDNQILNDKENIVLHVLCSSYNILRIMGGMAAIGFS